MIQKLSNQFLIDAYIQSLILKLDFDFISLLEKEIQRRRLPLMWDRTGEWQEVI